MTARDPARRPDLARLAAALGDIPHATDAKTIRKKSRDFYWYSPVLTDALKHKLGEIVVTPRNEEDVVETVRACVASRVPITVRGAGTGNYGQAVPLHGGVILDMIRMDKITGLEGGVLTVGPGKKLIDIEEETRPQGWELRLYPSTRRTATVGGFLAGGSTGIGAITHGLLADRGAVNGLRIVTCEAEPRVITLEGDAVNKVMHAYGTNGIITEIALPMAPVQPWRDIAVVFDNFMRACRFCQALGEAPGITKKLITACAAPIASYLPTLRGLVPEGRHLVMLMIADQCLVAYGALLAAFGGREVYRKTEAETIKAGVPPLHEYAWNHTTLYALKVDKTVTYLQTLFPPPGHLEMIGHMVETFGDETPMHLEFVRLGGQVGCFGLQILRYTSEARMRAIIAYYEAKGCPVFDPHTFILEDGGMKQVDEAQLAFKREADPFGLLNPGKMRAWSGA